MGVLPPGFVPPAWSAPDPAWDGLIVDHSGWAAIGPEGMVMVPVARLAPGASVAAARTELDALVQALAPQLRGPEGQLPLFRIDPIQSALFSRFRANAWLILSASAVLLLLACANLANLLLARGRSREYDAAIHASLGAGPGRQRLSEVLGPVTVTVTAISAGLEPALKDPRFRAVLFTVLSLAALLLAAIGLYAIASFDVAQRRYEMAVRLALGARARDIQRLVIFGACRPVVLGVLLGVAGAYWAEQFLKSFLFGVEPRDPAAYAVVVLILLATTTLAAWLPARRAVRVDPATTLRAQ
ncbi:MAG: FtsX-like permease family protein [Vicinamibacterales bacterium]